MIPRLHIITDDPILHRASFLDRAREVLAAGEARVALHIRGPGSEGGFLYRMASELLTAAEDAGATLLANDRLDVAMALDLPGIHLGRRSLPARVARKLLGPGKMVGASVHGREEVEVAGREVDYLVVGTLFPTPSHPGISPSGPGILRDLGGVTTRPLVGIGGITPDRVIQVLETGAHGIAVRGGVWDAPDPAVAVGVFLKRVDEGIMGLDGGG